MKKLLWAVVVVVVLIVIGAFVFAALLDSESVGRSLLARVSKSSGLDLKASSISLGLFSGIELEDVTASGEYSRGDYSVRLERLVFRHQLAPLLSGNFVIDQVVFEGPVVEVVVRRPTPEPTNEAPLPEEEERSDLRLEVREILVADGQVTVWEEIPGKERRQNLVLEGVELTLRDIVFDTTAEKPVHRIAGRGEVQIERLQPGDLVLADAYGQIELREGRLEATDIQLTSRQGELQARLSADFNPVPFTYELHAVGAPLDVNGMVGMEGGSLGPGRLEFDGAGLGSNPEGLAGQGLLHLEPGKIPDHPVIVRVQQVLGLQDLSGSDYQASDARFDVNDKVVRIEGFSLSSPQVGLAMDGTAHLDGPLNLGLQLRVRKDQVTVPGVPPQVLEALADAEGWVVIPVRVVGDRQNPKVTPDTEALLSQAGKGLFRLFGGSEEGKNPLERLLNPSPDGR